MLSSLQKMNASTFINDLVQTLTPGRRALHWSRRCHSEMNRRMCGWRRSTLSLTRAIQA